MDFLNRSAASQAPHGRGASTNSSGGTTPTPVSSGKQPHNAMSFGPKWLRVGFVVLLFSATILILATASFFHFANMRESRFVKSETVQAVFLTSGQVYFGQIKSVTNGYYDMRNIYYLNSQSQPDQAKTTTTGTNFSLVKLGCELHGPVDQMIINRQQVTFWENLRTDGQVAKAIAQWVKDNPNGQTCKTDTATTQPTATTPATSTTTKKP